MRWPGAWPPDRLVDRPVDRRNAHAARVGVFFWVFAVGNPGKKNRPAILIPTLPGGLPAYSCFGRHGAYLSLYGVFPTCALEQTFASSMYYDPVDLSEVGCF